MDNTRNLIIKIVGLSLAFSVLIYFASSFFFWENNTWVENNKNNFKNINNEIIGSTWVALTTSVWTRHTQIISTPATLYQDVMTIKYILANKQTAKDKIISTNMKAINEYLNLLQTDTNSLLASSTDRANTLEFFIDQLKYRHNNAIDNVRTLQDQINLLQSNITSSEDEIERIKNQMESDFDNFDSSATLENIDAYLKQREIYNYSYTYIVFINKFITQYTYLNRKTKLLVDSLENNREALIKNVTVTIPDSGSWLLDDLKILTEN